jgi:fructokinase
MVAVIGEALIDLVQQPTSDGAPSYLAHPGGSPFNVAIGLRRLGQPTALWARLGTDAFGGQLRTQAVANDLDLAHAVRADEPTTLAVVGLDEQGNARYDFYVEGTADWQWTAGELAGLDSEWVHTGSLASWLEPGAAVIADRLREVGATGAVVSFDPNIRPALMPDHPAAVSRIEGLVALAQVVKASAEDLAWLYPGVAAATVLDRWSELGPSLVVVTDGPNGATARQRGAAAFHTPGLAVPVIDTVGAGDAFMAGLIDSVLRCGRHPAEMSAEQAAGAVSDAVLVSALTCQRAGADPPTAAQRTAAQAQER